MVNSDWPLYSKMQRRYHYNFKDITALPIQHQCSGATFNLQCCYYRDRNYTRSPLCHHAIILLFQSNLS